MKVKKIIFISVLIFSVLPLLVVSFFFADTFARSTNKLMHNQLDSFTRSEALALADSFRQMRLNWDIFDNNTKIYAVLQGRADASLQKEVVHMFATQISELVRKQIFLEKILILDNKNIVIMSTDEQLLGKLMYTNWIADNMGQSYFVDSDAKTLEKTETVYTFIHPLADKGERLGCIVQVVDVEALSRNMQKAQTFFDTANMILIDDVGNVVVFSAEKLFDNIYNINGVTDLSDLWRKMVTAGKNSGFLEYDLNDTRKVAFYQRIINTKWYLLNTVDKTEFYAPIWEVSKYLLLILGLLLLTLFFGYKHFEKKLLFIVEHFLEVISQIQAGNYTARLDYKKDNELGIVAKAFDDLVEQIGSTTTQLKASQAKFEFALISMSERIFEIDVQKDRIISGKEHWQKDTDVIANDIYSENIRVLAEHFLHPEDKEHYLQTFALENIKQAYENGQDKIYIEYRSNILDPNYKWLSCTIVPIYDAGRDTLIAVACLKDINTEKNKVLDMLDKAQRDSMTGLYNKKITQEFIDTYLKQVQDEKCALIIVDIDNFKQVNDKMGHAVGDELLLMVSAEMKKVFRESDILGRIGGDEFVLFLKDIPNEELLHEKLQTIKKMFAQGLVVNDQQIGVSASIGAAVYPTDGTDYLNLYKKADIAMYKAKEQGKNQYCIYSND